MMTWSLVVTLMVVCLTSSEAFRTMGSTASVLKTPMMLQKTLPESSALLSSRFGSPLGGKREYLAPLTMATTTELSATADKPAPEPVVTKPSERKTLKKLFPLGAMLFFILFNYTILRDTKDVLVVTAPNSGAEIIPFLKTYVNLPSAIGFTILYSSLTNKMPADKVFYLIMSSFIAFFGAFATLICT